MRWILRLSSFHLSIIYEQGSKYNVSDAFYRLRSDLEAAVSSDEDKIPNFEDATVIAVRTESGTLGYNEPTQQDSRDPRDANEDAGDDP